MVRFSEMTTYGCRRDRGAALGSGRTATCGCSRQPRSGRIATSFRRACAGAGTVSKTLPHSVDGHPFQPGLGDKLGVGGRFQSIRLPFARSRQRSVDLTIWHRECRNDGRMMPHESGGPTAPQPHRTTSAMRYRTDLPPNVSPGCRVTDPGRPASPAERCFPLLRLQERHPLG